MNIKIRKVLASTAILSAFLLLVGGCGGGDRKAGQAKEPTAKSKKVESAEKSPPTAEAKDAAGEGPGWWCDEHGVPEETCSLCSAKAAAEFKKKGDWCNEHDRAKSQCFVCDPKLKDKFASQYRAKYGKEPPPIEEDAKPDGKAKEGRNG